MLANSSRPRVSSFFVSDASKDATNTQVGTFATA